MTLTDVLNTLFQYSLFHLYTPAIKSVGFSHPVTFAILTAHNTFSLTYLLFTSAMAYPALKKKTWLIPASITLMWIMISINIIAALNISTATVIAATLPHGWLEFAAIIYWVSAIRKATKSIDLPTLQSIPTFRDYLKSLSKPKELASLVQTDVRITCKMTKSSIKALSKSLRRAYFKTLILITAAALIETYITPSIMFLVSSL